MEEVGIWRMRTTSGHLYLEYCQYRSVVILELVRRFLFNVRRYNCFKNDVKYIRSDLDRTNVMMTSI